MDSRFFPRNFEPHECATLRSRRYRKHTADQFGAFAHGYEPNPSLHFFCHKARAMILHFELQRIRGKLQPDPRFARSGMPAHIIQRLLQHAINVRSEEHTSELQSRSDLVCQLQLEKKKKKK